MMSIQSINRGSGHYNISTGFEEAGLRALAADSSTKYIQFSAPLSNDEIDLLERIVFSQRQDIALRIFGHYTTACDLTFLERIPSLKKVSIDCLIKATGINTVTKLKNLETLAVGILNLDNFDFLEKINPNLKELFLYQTRSKKPNIECIERFKNLEYLYLERQQNGINAISKLKELKKIVLRSISTPNIDFLEGLEDLWSVNIKLGGIKSFEPLKNLPSIKYLELWQVRGLSDLSFISALPSLQNLFIQSLKQVTALPDLSKSKLLRRISLESMSGLTDVFSLKDVPNLKEFIIWDGSQNADFYLPVFENPTVESVNGFLGSAKRNNRFAELARQYHKKTFEYSDFIYK
ncbi:hypothetical protein [Sphingobacterium sp. BIGb0165]|uniref:hypothetical protein n=1 Tax=Sphingobacterium sp. BIGb0165 TaxID=2940615 RepID=UPI00216A0F6C|nr:hypothetical protein [Sphingobacterium sp. BIGb0165]MCS4226930.1 hypothetical protein [Sphingobacterium sp. BIGb0165]